MSSPVSEQIGTCHCGAVRFRIDADITELRSCSCPNCLRKSPLLARVPANRFELLQGHDSLTLYQFHARHARHYYCHHCGVQPFQRRRASPAEPEQVDVNVFCLEDFDPTGLPIVADASEPDILESRPLRAGRVHGDQSSPD